MPVDVATTSSGPPAVKLGAKEKTLCGYCKQTVFKMEEFKVDNSVLHRQCFKCTHCKRKLTISNFASVNGKFYCKTHYLELFAKSGGTYGVFGDAGFKKASSDSFKGSSNVDVTSASFKLPIRTLAVSEQLKPSASSFKQKKATDSVHACTGSSSLLNRMKQYEKVAGSSFKSITPTTSFKENQKAPDICADSESQTEQVKVEDQREPKIVSETQPESEVQGIQVVAVKETASETKPIPKVQNMQTAMEEQELVSETKPESEVQNVQSAAIGTEVLCETESAVEESSVTNTEGLAGEKEQGVKKKLQSEGNVQAADSVQAKITCPPSAPAAIKLGGKEKTLCGYCNQTVFKMEEFKVDNSVLHRQCFKCTHCKRKLTISSFASVNGKFYCKTHYLELFAKSGGTYGVFGDAGFKKASSDSFKMQSKPDATSMSFKLNRNTMDAVEASKPSASSFKDPKVTKHVTSGNGSLKDRLKQYEITAAGGSLPA